MMKTQDTCNPKCKFWKKYKENCPFFLETKWEEVEGGQAFFHKDCSPKRSVLLQMETYNRMIAVQREANVERDLQHGVVALFVELSNELLNNSSQAQITAIEDFEEVLEIPYTEEEQSIEDHNL